MFVLDTMTDSHRQRLPMPGNTWQRLAVIDNDNSDGQWSIMIYNDGQWHTMINNDWPWLTLTDNDGQ